MGGTLRRLRQVAAWSGIAVLVLALALPASAGSRDVQLRGVVVFLDQSGSGFVLRQAGRFAGGEVRVRVTGRTTIHQTNDGNNDDEEEDQQGADQQGVSVGDIVQVEGRMLSGGRLIARDVWILGRVPATLQEGQFPTGFLPFGVFPVPRLLSAPQIFFPTDGEVIPGPEFTVAGRTIPGATVHVDVLLVMTLARFQVAQGDVRADSSGFFALPVHPVTQYGGATYLLTVSGTINNQATPATTLTVHHE